MNRLLMTGASGFIGAHCLRLIEQAGGYDEIHAVNRRGEGPAQGRISLARGRPSERGGCGAGHRSGSPNPSLPWGLDGNAGRLFEFARKS